MITIGFNQSSYEVSEGVGSLQVCVSSVLGVLEREVTVMMEFLSNTSLMEDVVTMEFEPLVFSEESSEICREVVVVNDELFEDDEQFFIQLVSEDSVVLFSIFNASITVINDDGMFKSVGLCLMNCLI